jgi:hypothetical protein
VKRSMAGGTLWHWIGEVRANGGLSLEGAMLARCPAARLLSRAKGTEVARLAHARAVAAFP